MATPPPSLAEAAAALLAAAQRVNLTAGLPTLPTLPTLPNLPTLPALPALPTLHSVITAQRERLERLQGWRSQQWRATLDSDLGGLLTYGWLQGLDLMESLPWGWITFGLLVSFALLGTRRVIRIPILLAAACFLMFELSCYLGVRILVYTMEFVFFNPRHARLRARLAECATYEQWCAVAKELDVAKGMDAWKREGGVTTAKHNWALVSRLAERLADRRAAGDVEGMIRVLSECTRRTLGGIWDEQLYAQTHTGETKELVPRFIDQVIQTLEALSAQGSPMNAKHRKRMVKVAKKLAPMERDGGEGSRRGGGGASSSSSSSSGGGGGGGDSRGGGGGGGISSRGEALEGKSRTERFLERAKISFGETALCLSGGGTSKSHYSL